VLDSGLTIILSTKWIFVATLKNPYTKVRGKPVFADAFSYGGAFNLQTLEKIWPQTAGMDEQSMKPLDVLLKSSSD
jgi:hypothetical protein